MRAGVAREKQPIPELKCTSQKVREKEAPLLGRHFQRKTDYPIDQDPLAILINYLIPVIIDTTVSYIYVKSKSELMDLLSSQGNNSEITKILQKKKSGPFYINHPESKHTSPIPVQPKGAEIANRSEYKQYYKDLKKFVASVNQWIDEYPDLVERDLLREIGFKGSYSYNDLRKIKKASSNSFSRETWALKSFILAHLLREEQSGVALTTLRSLPLERVSTPDEKSFLHAIAKTLCQESLSSSETKSSSPFFDTISWTLLHSLEQSTKSQVKEVSLKHFFQQEFETQKAYETLAQALCENLHFLEITQREEKLGSLAKLKENSDIFKQVKVCSGHIEKLKPCKSREQIREIAKLALNKTQLDRSIQQPAHIFHKEKSKSSNQYEVLSEFFHYDDSKNCNHYKFEEKIDLVKSLGVSDKATFFEVIKDLLHTQTANLDFKDLSIAFRYNYNLLKIYLSLQVFNLEAFQILNSTQNEAL